MTEDQAINELKELQKLGDIEAAHSLADKALVAFIKHLGYDEVAKEYDKIEKWYA